MQLHSQKIISISIEDIWIIKYCSNSLLFYKNEAWKKKDTDTTCNVTTGRYDGAELWELIGI